MDANVLEENVDLANTCNEGIEAYSNFDSFKLYLNEIGQQELLTAEQEFAYAKLVQQGCMKARAVMIKANLRLVVMIGRRFLNRGLNLADIIAEGNLGLIRAVEKFDPNRGFRFSTYASCWIQQNIQNALLTQTKMVKLPIHKAKDLKQCLKAKIELSRNGEIEPTLAEIAEKVKKPLAEVKELLDLHEHVISLDISAADDNDKPFSNVLADENSLNPEQRLIAEKLAHNLECWLAELDDNEQMILAKRFGLFNEKPDTLENIGKEIDITRERVRQIQAKALNNLKMMLSANEIDESILLN